MNADRTSSRIRQHAPGEDPDHRAFEPSIGDHYVRASCHHQQRLAGGVGGNDRLDDLIVERRVNDSVCPAAEAKRRQL
jgi:hypothetical protein